MENEEIVNGTKVMLVYQIVRMGSRGAVILLLTRVFLEPDQYGLLFFALSVLGIGTLFAILGLAKSAARYIAEYRERDPGQLQYIIRTALMFNLVTIAVVGSVFILFNDVMARWLGEPRLAPFLLVGVAYVALASLQKFTQLTFQGFGRIPYSAGVGTVGNLMILVGVVVFLLLGTGPIGVMYGYVLGYAIAVGLAFWILYTKIYSQYEPASETDVSLRRRILSYSIPLTATRGSNVLDKRVDTILVGYFLSPVAVGYYTLGKQISAFAAAPAYSLGFSAAPAFGEHQAADDMDAAARLYENTYKYTLTLYLPATVGLYLVADPLIREVFGRGYLGAIPVVQLFSVYVLLQAVDMITSDSLDYLGRATARAYTKGIMAVGNFVLNLIAIPLFGVPGAAGATVLTYSGLVAVELVLVARDLPIAVGKLVRTTVLIGSVAAGMGIIVSLLVPFAENVISLSLVILVGVVVSAVLSTASGLINVEELRTNLT